jgi:chorismate lyase/3-hydroxybenzoate synthase
MMAPIATGEPTKLRVIFDPSSGPADPEAPRIPARCLAGPAEELIFPEAVAVETNPRLRLFRAGEFLVGHASEPFSRTELSRASKTLYRRILAACRGRHLVRLWNYVPDINGSAGGLEYYRAFCEGRSFAFEEEFGQGFRPKLPAASAVGSEGDQLNVIFAAVDRKPEHFENPEQVPAYLYPAEHGPRSPSFARATVAEVGGAKWAFISGTAAIKGHRTCFPDQLLPQIDCTLENLRLISKASGLGEDLGAAAGAARHLKVYLRRPEDLGPTRDVLHRLLVRPADRVTYLHADICRAELTVEIEATLVGSPA